jgi:uncharacterized delta-60 repeat protein
LDPAFSSDGLVTTNFSGYHGDSAYALALQPDGKLVAAGDTFSGIYSTFALARYNPDGSLDATFSGDGKLTTGFAGTHAAAYALVMQPDGKLVAAGQSGGNFALARYNPDGSLDATFDGDGKVVTSLGGYGSALALILQSDGKLVAAGYSSNNFALARYNLDGSLDTSFDGDGKLTTDFFGGTDEASALALQPDGKLVAAGRAGSGFALALNPDGSLTPASTAMAK